VGVTIYDTLSRTKVELEPRDPGRISMYVCGPTVYDLPHVGHGRTAVVYDVVRRYLAYRGFAVTFVSNITDVDDKIIHRAAATGRTEPEVAQEFEAAYWDQMTRLGVQRPDHLPHATEYVAEMIRLVSELVECGGAYVIEGQGVYFDVAAFPGYGALPHRDLAQLLESAGARVDVDEAKRSPVDFALWKAAKAGEPAWDSPWGPGRPGWHIECSAMSLGLLGEGFDLHGAGDDLVFPHNENERAQAEAAGHAFARHWMHSGMVEIAGEKMSKSLGNFTTLESALDAHGARAFRMAVLQAHYRRAVELGDSELAQAATALERFDALERRAAAAGTGAAEPDPTTMRRFADAMDDDFGTPAALAAAFEAVAAANRAIDAGDAARAGGFVAAVRRILDVLGLTDAVGRVQSGGHDDSELDALVAARDEARRVRDFATADRLRAELVDLGVELEDTPTGTVWRRV
jgi:cysteinyl-tRNA synthetase